MDYLSNYYKNLSEQLQEKINILEGQREYYLKHLDDTKDTETDDDIFAMRQNAADQGGIPQDMVNEPIRRTKQQPDGRLIYGESKPKPKAKPDIGLLVKPKMPLPYTKPTPELKIRNPNLLDKNKEEYGIIPQTPEQRKKFGMSPFDNRMS
jgi:hypothetical protein